MLHRWSLRILAVGWICLAARPVAADQAEDEKAIRKSVASYTAAFNKADAEALAAHWLPDAIYLDPDSGTQVVGRKAIAEHFAAEFKELKGAKLKVAVESIRFLSPHVAVEQGRALLLSKNRELSDSTYTAVHVKRDGKWLLDRVTEHDVPEIVSHYDKLKDLEWLVGTWIDTGAAGTEVRIDCSWARNRNYLVRTFTLNLQDRLTTSGIQIIGWDPAAKAIRSWVFDSDGGHGEGLWTKKGKAWHIRTTDVLPDGNRASAVSIVTPRDKNSFTWRSVDRLAGGTLLPNIDEVLVVRAASGN